MVKVDFAGCSLLGVAPCTAMVLIWGYLAKGNDGLTLVMVAVNSLIMLVLFGLSSRGGTCYCNWSVNRNS
ncbi:MAG TPA: hypothetical protein QF753_13955 [Victivallales bacterium]|nr:hypothetical protein [Victivallales bacterium]